MKEMDAYKNVITDYNNWWYEIQIDAFNSNGKSNGFFDPRSNPKWNYPYKDDYDPRPPALQINPTPSPTTLSCLLHRAASHNFHVHKQFLAYF